MTHSLSTRFARRTMLAIAVPVTSGALLIGAGASSAAAAAPAQTATVATATVAKAAAPLKRPKLSFGTRGAYVKVIQRRLKVTPVSGYFGTVTRAAVNKYKRAHGLPADGVVGGMMWTKLLKKPVIAVDYVAPEPTGFDLPRKNPRSAAQAVAWARAQTRGSGVWYRRCLNFTAQAYGWSYSGTSYAIDHFDNMRSSLKHAGDRTPPVGALVFWRTGGRAGHVAIYLGNGMIASNDISRSGYIDVVPFSAIESRWGARYAGWAAPYFPNGG